MLEEVITAIVVLNCIITLWIMRMIVHEVKLATAQIDTSLALAIKKLVEGGLGEFEPPNPIQQALGELLMNRVKDQQTIIEVPRDQTGKFTKD